MDQLGRLPLRVFAIDKYALEKKDVQVASRISLGRRVCGGVGGCIWPNSLLAPSVEAHLSCRQAGLERRARRAKQILVSTTDVLDYTLHRFGQGDGAHATVAVKSMSELPAASTTSPNTEEKMCTPAC